MNGTAQVDSLRNALVGLADDSDLMEIVESELGASALERLQARLRRIRETHYFIAVLGRQGVGKSSLLNALLFTRRVLPVDVTETTNVLCKVVGDEGRGPGVEVVFRDGLRTEGPATSEFLGQFVDEQRNTGNSKRVREVSVRHAHPILQTGIAFVDTPGVGSLVDRNSQTTVDFLPNVTAAIFVFSTTPTILKSEVDFLEETWEFAKHFFFVQNVWGEDLASLDSAGRRNLETIQRIAEKRDDDPSRLQLYTINIHAALTAATSGVPSDDATSGIDALSRALERHVGAGVARMRHADALSDARLVVSRARTAAAQRLYELKDESLRKSSEFDKKAVETRQHVRAARRAWEDACSTFEESVQGAGAEFDAALAAEFEELRTEFIPKVEARTTDPDHLAKAAEEQVRIHSRKAVTVYESGFGAAAESLRMVYERESRQIAGAVDGMFKDATEGADVALPEGFRTAGKFVAGAGGTALLYFAGEALLVAAGLTSGSIPVVGLAIAAVVAVIGLTVKKAAESKVKQRLKKAFLKAFADSQRKLSEGAHRYYRGQAEEIRRRLDRELRELMSDAEERIRRLEDDRLLSAQEAGNVARAIEERLARSAALIGRIDDLVARTGVSLEVSS